MPTLEWIGKAAVLEHHLEVPCRALIVDERLSAGDPEAGNLLIEGDNLEALRSLLPDWAGRIKCITIDPPYNSGFRGWSYDDAVKSPAMRGWLDQVVGSAAAKQDRQDAWLCMMYPRLRLMRDLLRDDGFIVVAIDDHEVSQLDLMMGEIFGASNRIVCAPWRSEPSGGKQKGFIRIGHEYLLIYARSERLSMTRQQRPVTGSAFADR